jgi:hypothetical protein
MPSSPGFRAPPPRPIGNVSATVPSVQMDAAGNALVTWELNGHIRSMRYLKAGNAWSTAAPLPGTTCQTERCEAPSLSMNAAGDAVVAWTVRPGAAGTRTDIWAARFSAATGTWTGAQAIETINTFSSTHPHVSMDDTGAAEVAWLLQTGAGPNLHANRMAPGGTWGTAGSVLGSSGGDTVQVATSQGRTILVFQASFQPGQPVGVSHSIRVMTGGWNGTQSIENEAVGIANDPRIVMDRHGRGIAAFRYVNGGVNRVGVNHFR